jgi:AbiU2
LRRFEELAMIDPKGVLNEFYNLCVEARCDFDLYCSMFENDQKKTTLCVDYAPYFFNDFGRILTRFLVLHVCRLTDPAGSGSKFNLTTNYILQNLTSDRHINDAIAEASRRGTLTGMFLVDPAGWDVLNPTPLHHIKVPNALEEVPSLGGSTRLFSATFAGDAFEHQKFMKFFRTP